MPRTPTRPTRPAYNPASVSIRGMMLGVAFVAFSIRWSAHWSDCKHRAAFHATLGAKPRSTAGQANARLLREADWHREMGRRFEAAAWLPWPFPPPEPPRPD